MYVARLAEDGYLYVQRLIPTETAAAARKIAESVLKEEQLGTSIAGGYAWS